MAITEEESDGGRDKREVPLQGQLLEFLKTVTHWKGDNETDRYTPRAEKAIAAFEKNPLGEKTVSAFNKLDPADTTEAELWVAVQREAADKKNFENTKELIQQEDKGVAFDKLNRSDQETIEGTKKWFKKYGETFEQIGTQLKDKPGEMTQKQIWKFEDAAVDYLTAADGAKKMHIILDPEYEASVESAKKLFREVEIKHPEIDKTNKLPAPFDVPLTTRIASLPAPVEANANALQTPSPVPAPDSKTHSGPQL